jgi:dihydrolipoamide dehydrogenase
MHYDVAVDGGGPGGYVAAIRAAQLGAKVLLAEKDKIGGVCLNRGCIPTKALLKSADKWRELKNCAAFGLKAENIGFDFAAVTARKDEVVAQLQSGIVKLVKSNHVAVVSGTAVLRGPKEIEVTAQAEKSSFTTDKIILAAGSVSAGLPVPGGGLPGVIDSDQLLSLTSVPKSMVVVGAGAVGIEFAAIFQAFGCRVTVVEMAPSILPSIDSDIVRRMAVILRKQGLTMLTGTKVKGIKPGPAGLVVEVENSKGAQEIPAKKVLAAIGRKPVLGGLGLEEAGVAYTTGGVPVNAGMETNAAGIYAVGDMTGRFMWAHAASAEGLVAAENAMGAARKMDYSAVPGCIFTSPEIAVVGCTEQEAAARGQKVAVSKLNFAANGKAVSMGEAEGLVKIIADAETRKITGMHLFGPHASDLIMEGAIAIRNGLTAGDIGRTIHPHPSLSETIMEAAHGIGGEIIHQLKIGRRSDS